MEVVKIENVSKRYLLGNQEVEALEGIDLIVEEGDFLAIAGPSGSGKSTLLNLIGCIDTPTTGQIYIEGHPIHDHSPNQLADLRARKIGFIFQTFNLLPVLSAEENVEYPLLQFKEMNKSERRERVSHFLRIVGLEKFARHRPNELSGGQRQRVAIARALVTRPKLVLADEPTANLDHKTGASILELMRLVNRIQRTTFVFSTHDSAVMRMANRLVQVQDGKIVREGAGDI